MKGGRCAVDNFVGEFGAFLSSAEKEVRSISRALLDDTPAAAQQLSSSSSGDRDATETMRVLEESVRESEDELRALVSFGGSLRPSAECMVAACSAVFEQQRAALEQLQQMASALGYNPYEHAPLRLSTVTATAAAQVTPEDGNASVPPPQKKVAIEQPISAPTPIPTPKPIPVTAVVDAAAVKEPPKEPMLVPPPVKLASEPTEASAGKGVDGDAIRSLQSIADLGNDVPSYLLSQMTLEKLNECIGMLNGAFGRLREASEPLELSTDGAVVALKGDPKAKTVLLILQKGKHIKMSVTGGITKWIPTCC